MDLIKTTTCGDLAISQKVFSVEEPNKEESVGKMYSGGIKIGSCSPVEIHFPDIKFDKEAALNVLRKIAHKHKTGNELRVLQDAEFEVVEPLQIEDKGGECE